MTQTQTQTRTRTLLLAITLTHPVLVLQANSYISSNTPWRFAMDPTRKDRLDTVIWYGMESVRLAALMLQPIMPTKASEILDRLDVRKDERSWEFAHLGRGWEKDTESRSIVPGGSVFPQLEKKEKWAINN